MVEKDMAEQGLDGIDVAYVANLARLHLTEEEIHAFQGQLEAVVAYVRTLSQLDLNGIEPTSHAHLIKNVFRPDKVKPGLEQESALRNAPERVGEQFMVPKIIE